ncbi:MAG: hypothetical protein HUJ67_02765, partial [Ruminiclostridium sp.]|nr:hypothetical protein [Ruminiclostridium sp.]
MSKLQPKTTSLSGKQRLALILAAVVILFAIVTALFFRDGAASLFRRLTFTDIQDDFSHNAQSNSLFLGVENELLVCSNSLIQVFSPSGDQTLKESVSMTSPTLNSAGAYTVVYDVGGQQLRLVHGSKLVSKLELASDESLLCATVNEKGWMAVTSKASGYKAVVTVYNPSFESVLSIRLSSRYISDAVVTPDCRGVYLVAPGQSGGAFENTLLYYTFSSKDTPTKTLSLGSNVVLSILSSGKCWILGDQSLLILDSSCNISASYDYAGQYLKMGTLQGDNFATLLLSRSSSGGSGTLVTVDAGGDVCGQLDLEGQTMGLAAQGDTVALLTTGELITSDRKLDKYRSIPNQRGVRNLAVYEDG